ncbi:MAG: GtrA family protein [Acidimicrobiaceae bacterium]|nr:GtrA family protein [Acidimicrobiaceae bacterium]MBO0747156.1 GtrA family protein [Acidimicrobiaceae bacterium]
MWGRLPQSLRRRLQSSAGRRLLRFAPAAILALAASQITYFLFVNVFHATGRVSGFAGWFAGATVSYGVSRWAWERRGRPQLLKETLPFIAVSLCVGGVLTEVSHVAYHEAQRLNLHGVKFGLFVQGLYISANVVTFLIRFLLFNYVIFAGRTSSSTSVSSTPG